MRLPASPAPTPLAPPPLPPRHPTPGVRRALLFTHSPSQPRLPPRLYLSPTRPRPHTRAARYLLFPPLLSCRNACLRSGRDDSTYGWADLPSDVPPPPPPHTHPRGLAYLTSLLPPFRKTPACATAATTPPTDGPTSPPTPLSPPSSETPPGTPPPGGGRRSARWRGCSLH